MGFIIVVGLLSYPVSLIGPAISAAVFALRFEADRRLFRIIAACQLVVHFGLMYLAFSDFPTAAAVIAPGILAVVTGLSALFGLLVYPVAFLIRRRPERWQAWTRRLITTYVVTAFLIALPTLIDRSGLTTNVDLHGRVIDINGDPVVNARVYLGNCAYIDEKITVTDADGRFDSIANCSSYFVIESIHHPVTGAKCLSRYQGYSERYGSFMVFDSLSGPPLSQGRPHWNGYPRDNPYTVTCIWEPPANVERFSSGTEEIIPDNRPYTLVWKESDYGWHFEVEEGEHYGPIQFRLMIDSSDSATDDSPPAGRFEITQPGGGIQATTDHFYYNLAPADGYEERTIIELENPREGFRQSFYFHGEGNIDYGVLTVYYRYMVDGRSLIDFTSWINYDGERVLLSHLFRP